MFMLTLFESKKIKANKEQLRTLVALAKADGHLDSSEIDLIYKIGEKRGLRDFEVANLLTKDYNTKDLNVPQTDIERFNQIFEMLELVHADGVVSESEIDFCIEIAEKYGFSEAFAGVVVNKISMGLSYDLSKEQIKSELESFLNL